MDSLMRKYITNQITETHSIMGRMLADEGLLSAIESVTQVCIDSLKSGGKILLAGNGGSAADAQHIAGEFVSRFAFDRPGLPAIRLIPVTFGLIAPVEILLLLHLHKPHP